MDVRSLWNGTGLARVLRESPPSVRRVIAATYVFVGILIVLVTAAIITEADWLETPPAWMGVGAAVAFPIGVIIVGLPLWRESREAEARWAAAPVVETDPASLSAERDTLVCRRPLRVRVGYPLFALGFVGVGINILRGGPPLAWLIGGAVVLWMAWWILSMASDVLIVTHEVVAVRNQRHWRSARLREVEEVEPTDDGLSLRLEDGRAMLAAVTRRDRLPFQRVRYDAALLDEIRARVSEARSARE